MRERIVEMPFDLPAEPFGHAGQQVRQFVSAGDRRRQLLCVLLDERLLVLVPETALRARGIKLSVSGSGRGTDRRLSCGRHGLPATVGGRAVLDVLNDDRTL